MVVVAGFLLGRWRLDQKVLSAWQLIRSAKVFWKESWDVRKQKILLPTHSNLAKKIGGNMGKQKILLVDDESNIVETIQFSLEQEGYDVMTAADGVEALTKARENQLDLMVLDVMMPKENGYRVSQKIREDEKAGRLPKRTPIILLTARNLEGDPDREKMFMDFAQADVMMYKPFEMDDLLKHIHALLNQ